MYALEEDVDYSKEDLDPSDGGSSASKYNPNLERKLILTRLGPCEDSDSKYIDRVFQDSRIQYLLCSAESNSDETILTSPPGKNAIRTSSIRLPSSPYNLLTVDQVLRHLLPTTNEKASNGNPVIEEIPSSFEVAGHIAHVNLREEALPYKYLIGKAILEKNQTKIRVVVNKIGNIENEFRTFPMEILAGEGLDLNEVERLCACDINLTDGQNSNESNVQFKIGPEHDSLMQVELKEHGCRFQLDFARVYWNSRLQGEHGRLVQQIVEDAARKCNNDRPNPAKITSIRECVVADVMAGVGPFAVPLTSALAPHYHKTPIVCHANDLNPISFRYLKKNAKLNKCFSGRLEMYNLDGREFIHHVNQKGLQIDHFIMNLPAMAPEFLDAFRGWEFKMISCPDELTLQQRPVVHVHCFGEKSKSSDDIARVETQVLRRCETSLGCPGCLSSGDKRKENLVSVRVVRDVGPRKNMLCVSFILPLEVAGVKKLVLNNTNGNGKREREEDNAQISQKLKKSTSS